MNNTMGRMADGDKRAETKKGTRRIRPHSFLHYVVQSVRQYIVRSDTPTHIFYRCRKGHHVEGFRNAIISRLFFLHGWMMR